MRIVNLFVLCILLHFYAANASAQGYKRVVSLAPSLTTNIYIMNAQSLLVGCTSFCQEGVADGKEVVASAMQVNVEQLVRLKPDLVITTELTNPETIALIKKFGVDVRVFPKMTSFDEICKQFLELGATLGYASQAQAIVTDSKQRLERIKRTPSGGGPKIFFQIGAKPLFTVIPHTFMHDYITFAGGQNIAHDFSHGTITRESVISRNPDAIIIVTMGILGDEEKSVWEGYKSLSATQRGKIFIVDSHRACSPSPSTFVETLEELIQLIY